MGIRKWHVLIHYINIKRINIIKNQDIFIVQNYDQNATLPNGSSAVLHSILIYQLAKESN